MATFREAAYNLSPPRLRKSNAARMLYSFVGIPLDAIANGVDKAVKAAFPQTCPDDALPFLSRDRGIIRGPLEPGDSFRKRLLLWIQAWEGAGVGQAMLDQIAGFLTPHNVRLRIWTQVGVVYTRELDGTLSIERAAADAWNWDGQADVWARFWLIIYSVDGKPWVRDGKWNSGGTWNDSPGLTWGSSATVAEARSIRGIVDEFKPALSKCQNIMITFDADAFDPDDAGLPNGTWGNYWDSATQSANRDRRALYWKGV